MPTQSVTLVVPSRLNRQALETSLNALDDGLKKLPSCIAAELLIATPPSRDRSVKDSLVCWGGKGRRLKIRSVSHGVETEVLTGDEHFPYSRFTGPLLLMKQGEMLNADSILRVCEQTHWSGGRPTSKVLVRIVVV